MMTREERNKVNDTNFMKAMRKKCLEWEALAESGYEFTSEEVKNMMKVLSNELGTQLSLV